MIVTKSITGSIRKLKLRLTSFLVVILMIFVFLASVQMMRIVGNENDTVHSIGSILEDSVRRKDLLQINQTISGIKLSDAETEVSVNLPDGTLVGDISCPASSSTVRTVLLTGERFIVCVNRPYDLSTIINLALGFALAILIAILIFHLVRIELQNIYEDLLRVITGDSTTPIYAEVKAVIMSIQRASQVERESSEKLIRLKVTQDIAKKVAHDIRSPLTALKTLVSVGVDTEEKRSLLSDVTDRITRIANDILQDYKILKTVQLCEPNLSIQKLLAEKQLVYGNEINFQYDVDASSGKLPISSTDFERIISNLINNSVEADADIVQVKLSNAGSFVSIEIEDNGKGFSGSALMIGNRAQVKSSKANGHGIGISSAKEKLEAIGGQLMIQSNTVGTTVRLTLPRAN